MKRAYRYRCLNRVNGRTCYARRSLPMLVEWYRSPGRVPRCRSCGCRSRYYRDRWKEKHELANPCRCARFPFPHRKGAVGNFGPYGYLCCLEDLPF